MEEYLAIADADKIHEYVFSPRELKMIRGGSAIQVDLNYEDLPRIATANGGTVIFRGGGTLLAKFPSPDAADKFCKDSAREFASKTGVATVSTAKAPYDPARFTESLRLVRNSLERNKQERRERTFNGGGSYWANCHACGVFPAMSFSKSDPTALLCEACGLREQASKRRKNYPDDVEPPEDFNAIGAFAKPEGYVALIYIDLDRLGKHLSDYAEASEERYRKISTLIDESVKRAVQKSCEELLTFAIDGKKHAGYEILLRGGDDAVVLVPAQYGWRVLERFDELFQDEYSSAEKCSSVPKFSAGVVM